MVYKLYKYVDGEWYWWCDYTDVKDRFPDDEQDVLIFTETVETYGKHKERKKIYHNIFYGYCDSGTWLTSYCHGCEYIEKMNEKFPDEHITVTHWMPLPDPPKEGFES